MFGQSGCRTGPSPIPDPIMSVLLLLWALQGNLVLGGNWRISFPQCFCWIPVSSRVSSQSLSVPCGGCRRIGFRSPPIGPIVPSESLLSPPVIPRWQNRWVRRNQLRTYPNTYPVRTFRAYLRKRWFFMPSGDISRNLSRLSQLAVVLSQYQYGSQHSYEDHNNQVHI
jgi:hypothetical protein